MTRTNAGKMMGRSRNKKIPACVRISRHVKTMPNAWDEPQPSDFRSDALPLSNRELVGERGHILGSYVTSVLHTARINNVLCGDSLQTGFPFPNYSDGGGIPFLGASHLVAGASRRRINLLCSSKPGACSQASVEIE